MEEDTNQRSKVQDSLRHFRAIYEDSDHTYISSETDESDYDSDQDNVTSATRQFKKDTKGHKQQYISLNTTKEDKWKDASEHDSANTSEEDNPIPSTSTGITGQKRRHISESSEVGSIGIESDSETQNIRSSTFTKKGSQIDLKLTRQLHRREKQFSFFDDLYAVQFTPKTTSAPTILSLFLAFTQALEIVLDKMRNLYKDRLSTEDHLLNLTVTEDTIQVSKKKFEKKDLRNIAK